MVTASFGGASMVVVRYRCVTVSPRCSANSEALRSTLDRLHAEAESTRAKANSNRSRLVRLSKVAENLRKQAAANVQRGKENDARELLLQKKKVMQALDKAKARIELLDTLSSKLNEAISAMETHLIQNISLDKEDSSGPVHIVDPPEPIDSQENQLIDAQNHLVEDLSTSGISSYESFLQNLDQQLGKIDAELSTFVNVEDDKPIDLKVKQMGEILEDVHRVRTRIANIICKEANIS